jgi:diguanylate cyclase (GGDEF)-like protein
MKDASIVTEKIMFVKHYNTLNMTLEDIEKIVGDSYKKGLLYHRYSRNDIKEPYEPLINGIRYYYQKLFANEMSVAEFVDECNVYSLHKEIFVSYLKTGRASRTEQIIISEITYERKKFIQSIINCLTYISKKTNLLIVLDRFQLSPLSTMQVINQMIDEMRDGSIKILIIYNEFQTPLRYVEESFNKIINVAEEKNILFEWEDKEDKNVKFNDYHSAFTPSKRYFDAYIAKLSNMYQMLAIEDAMYYMDIINNRIVEEKLIIDNGEKISFYSLRALCNIMNNDSNNALLNCEKILPLCDEKNEMEIKYRYNYICGIAHISMAQSESAIKYAKRCIEIAHILNDETKLIYGEILVQRIQFGDWRDTFSVEFNNIVADEKLYDKLRRFGFMNTLAYCIAFAYDNDDDSIKRIVEGKDSESFLEAIRIGEEIGNTNLLLSAYTKYIVVFTDKGYLKYTDKYYNKKLSIVSKEHDIAREAHLHMGMGYNCIICEQFIRANEHFNKAIEILYSLKNAEEIIEALYNMSVNCICAQDYLSACDYLNVIFKMLDNLELESIQICNASRLQGMLALSYYMLGNEYRCYKCLNNMEIYMSHLLHPEEDEEPEYYRWNDDLFLYYFINGILAKNNGAYDEAYEFFKKAEKHYETYSGGLFYILQNYIVEYYDLYIKCNEPENAMAILEKGLEQCNKYGYTLKYQNIMLMVEGKSVNARPLTGDFAVVSMPRLIELSYNVGKEKQLAARKKDITFLSSIQEMLNRDDIDYMKLINNTMTTMQNCFNLDSMLLIKKENNEIKELYRDIEYAKNLDYNEIFEFMNVMKREFMSNRTDRSFVEVKKIVSMFGTNKIVTLVGVPVVDENGVNLVFLATVNMHKNFRRNRVLLSDNDLVIINTAVMQLESSIKRLKNRQNIVEMNEKLNALAITDMLTGLYNRQGFARKMEESKNCVNSVAILYADLDNFKYYNDTFGHDVGDVVLVEFAKVFRKIAQNIGYAVRYGGDEFLMVLNNVSKEEACAVADSIYDALSDGFVDVVRRYVNKDVVVPDNKLLSCSIGIASSDNCSGDNIKELLQKADEALYYMKRNHKGSYALWENIHE